jgi:hypothetical protein
MKGGSMNRVVTLAGLLALGGIAALGYLNSDHYELTNSKVGFSEVPQQQKSTEEFSESAIGDNAKKLPEHAGVVPRTQTKNTMDFIAPEIIAQWLAAASDDDAGTRAAAIAAFAAAPKAQAVPALQKILSGAAEQDRQLALQSLRILVSNQGDADGEIRDVLRLTIYDGDDAGVASSAQTLLEAIDGAANAVASAAQANF